MHKSQFAAAGAALALALAPGAALAKDPGPAYPDADWTQTTITEPDGTVLDADVLRDKSVPLDAAHKQPVIISVGPYFNHSGQTGAPTDYDPQASGPSTRFQDFVEGSKLLQKGYTWVQVDLRGFGGSTGCEDWAGPGEQTDVVEAIKWAVAQPWSNGSVGTYGKSYDAVTGLIAADKHPAGLKAVVAGEPVYDVYRYLYGDGIRRLNSAATPGVYTTQALTPGTVNDDPMYNLDGANDIDPSTTHPVCKPQTVAELASNDDHYSPYWRSRDFISQAKGSMVPVFITQGLTENNTAPDGVAEFLQNHPGPERGWLGRWVHARGNEMDGNKLAMGRRGWFDEVMRYYEKYVRGIEPGVEDPPFAIQSITTGRWRPELQWPPADATSWTTDLASGSYTDNAQSAGTGSSTGVWTVSKPLPYDVHMAGAATIVADVSSATPNSNLVADIYDLDASGKGPLVARQGSLIRHNGPVTLHMMSSDWKFVAGHRIGVRITDNNSEWWVAAIPTMQTVSVYGGSATFPFLRYKRTQVIQGDSGTTRGSWLAATATAPAAAVTGATDFNLPPALDPEPDALKHQLDKFN